MLENGLEKCTCPKEKCARYGNCMECIEHHKKSLPRCKRASENAGEVKIRRFEPGDAGYVAYMHGKYYCEQHGFFSRSEYYFIKHLADFVHDPEGGNLWIAMSDNSIAGSIAIVRIDNETAQLRWFIVLAKYQKMGIGSSLMRTAIDFCHENGYKNVFLWTFKGLDAARRLYEKSGFVLTEEKPNNEWSSVEITEQKMELRI